MNATVAQKLCGSFAGRCGAAALTIAVSAAVCVAGDNEAVWWLDTDVNTCMQGKLEYFAQQAASEAYDEKTGRDLRNFPPDRVVDFGHMKLDMRFDDLNEQRFTATETLSFIPIGAPTESLKLDAVGLQINSVTMNGDDVPYFQDDHSITVTFNPPLALGKERALQFEYVCDHPTDGMFFTPYSPDAPNYTAEVHTQGESESNRHWFIAHDYPNERMTTEIIADVPGDFMVSSNGKLVSHQSKGDREIWHYLQDKPHVSYLVSLVIGKFDVVELDYKHVPMKVWAPLGQGENVRQTFGRTGKMIDTFEKRMGVPYPWDKYDQIMVKNFGAGGMENTSVTSLYPTTVLDKTALLDGDQDSLIAHELGHQWTGDLITCKSWEHIWLNEGWATYLAALWFEQRDGEDGYLDYMRGQFRVAFRDKTTDAVGMVSPIYADADEPFRRRANPYPKGSSILHMLRMMLGEDAFWNGVHLYMKEHSFGVAETNDFRYALEEASGKGLEWFFEQWCYRPGTPELDVAIDFDGRDNGLRVKVEQNQTIDERTPAFRFELPVFVRTARGSQTYTINVTEKSTTYTARLDGAPTMVAVDPYLHVLKTITVHKPQELWFAQMKDGPTIVAKYDAIRALGESETPRYRDAMVALIADEDAHRTLRSAAVNVLHGYSSDAAKSELLQLLKDGIDEARVRVDLIGALGDYPLDDVGDTLAGFAENDPSYDCRTTAVRRLARLKAKDYADLMVKLAPMHSQHERLRGAVLSALADFDDERGLALAMEYSRYGNTDRSRPGAISAMATLAHYDKDAVLDTLINLLNDPESRARSAAMFALVDVADERGVKPLQAIADTSADPGTRDRAKRALTQLQEKLKDNNDNGGAGGPAGRRGRFGGGG